MAENNNDNKIRKNLEEKFKQLLSKEEEAPANLKKEVFSTLDTLHLLGDMADLFTTKFTQTETSFLDMIQDEEDQESNE